MKFSVMCVGDNPMDIMSQYDVNREVEEHVRYRFKDAGKYREAAILTMEKMLERKEEFPGDTNDYFELMEMRLTHLKMTSDLEYYFEITSGMNYDKDNNAITNENEEGKWEKIRMLNVEDDSYYPLELKGGGVSYSAKNSDIDWEMTNMPTHRVKTYERVWEMVIEGDKPKDKQDDLLFGSMSDKKDYLLGFGTKEKYVKYCTSYWCTAFVDKNGWHDVKTDSMGSYEDWILNFYDRFIVNLLPNDKVTILECEL